MLSAIKKLLLSIFIFTFCLTACHKDKDNDAPVTTGSISGIIQPAGAVTQVAVFDTIIGKNHIAIPDSSGRFIITSVPPGSYYLHFTIDSMYSPNGIPSATTVKNNETTDLGVLRFVPKQNSDTMGTAKINGSVFPAAAFGDILVTSADNKHQYKATHDGNGYFLLLNVVPGTYTVHFTITDASLQAPGDSVITVSKDQFLELGNIYATAKPGSSSGKTDTIVGTYINETYLLSRAPYDSLIVIQGNLFVFSESNTEALSSALHKITSISGAFFYPDQAVTTIEMDKLTYLGALNLFNLPNLTSASFSNLKTVAGGITLYLTPQLTTMDLPLLETLSGSISLTGTAFSNLDLFRNTSLHPFNLELISNLLLIDVSVLSFGSDSVYNLTVTGNPLLTTLNGLQGIRLAKNKITVSNNPLLQTLDGMNNINNTDQLEMVNNQQLTTVCPAKTVINAVKNRPSYTKRLLNSIGDWVTITIDPFVASNDGNSATEADVTAAVAQCP